MKTIPIFVEFPDNFSEEEVLYSIFNNIPMDKYADIGIRFKTNSVLAASYRNYLNHIGMLSLSQPVKTKS